MKGKYGFTLIELLVVISIIAVLLAVLLPSLSAVRMHAKKVASTSNMRQIGLSMELYTEDNRGFFPETSHGLTGVAARKRSWIYTLSSYINDVNEIRICPADPKRKDRLVHNTSSYIMNEYIAVDTIDPFGRTVRKSYRNKYKLRRANRSITTFVGADDLSAALTSDHTHSRLWFRPSPNIPWDAIRNDIQPDRYTASQSKDNTKGSSLYLYADAHVENIKARQIKEMADNYDNFARPPEK